VNAVQAQELNRFGKAGRHRDLAVCMYKVNYNHGGRLIQWAGNGKKNTNEA
jgi:hypothetical protein